MYTYIYIKKYIYMYLYTYIYIYMYVCAHSDGGCVRPSAGRHGTTASCFGRSTTFHARYELRSVHEKATCSYIPT